MSRMKIELDNNWIFKNEDIAIPYAIKAGRTGMPTDGPDIKGGAWLANKQEEEDPSIWHFEEWEKVTIPHDWAIAKEYDPQRMVLHRVYQARRWVLPENLFHPRGIRGQKNNR